MVAKPKPVNAIDVLKKSNEVAKRKISDHLPAILNTDILKVFFENTADNLFQPEISEKISGFIGQVPSHTNTATDFYIKEPTKERQEHQLEPTLISFDPDTNETTNIMFYDDVIDLLRFQGGLTNNIDRLFKSETYSWLPPINPDMLMNFTNYFWFPSGPNVEIFNILTNISSFIGSSDPVTIEGISFIDGLRVQFTQDINLLYNDRVFVVSGIGSSFTLLTDDESDAAGWDDVILGWDIDPWDGVDKKIIISAETPDYIVMERISGDNNAWSTRNRWYHRDELTLSQLAIALDAQAARPIIEFQKNMELFNHGTFGRNAVTVRDDTTTNPSTQILGQPSYTIDGIDIRNGDTVLFTNLPTFQGSWGITGWDFETPGAIDVTPLGAPHPQLGQLGFEWASGTFDPFSAISYSAPTGDITFTRISSQAAIITLSENFLGLGFAPGMTVVINGTTANDGEYTISTINVAGTIMTFVEDAINPGDLSVSTNFTIGVKTVVYQNRIFLVSGKGTPSGLKLTLITDGQNIDGSPSDGDQIRILLGTIHQNKEYYWSDATNIWVESQEKLTVNQAPLFQLYDTKAVRLQDVGEYPLSDFSGNKIFSYQINTDLKQPVDSVLSVPLVYNSFGEIIFQNHLVTDRVGFNAPAVDIIGYYFYKIKGIRDEIDNYENGWNLKDIENKQFIVDSFNVTEASQSAFILSVDPSEVSSIQIFVNGIQDTSSTWWVNQNILTFNNSFLTGALVKIKYYSTLNIPDGVEAIYELPINLSANADNEEIEYIANSEYFSHFTSVIANQPGLVGSPNSANNWRNTDKLRNVGSDILQHKSPLLKLLALGSNKDIDFMLSARYVEREYSRFRNKFLRKLAEYNKDGVHTSAQTPETWIEDALTAINLGKIDDFPFSLSGMGTRTTGEPTYYPSSPSRVGIFGVYKPEKYIDTSYNPNVYLLQMHDGSVVPAFNDFRDDVILELENNIYNSIPAAYKTERLPDFDWTKYVDTFYYTSEYTIDEFNALLTPILQRWAVLNNLDLQANTIYSPTDAFTWNYSKQGVPGYWRGIYKFYYETDRPNTHPWEMFGFSEKPVWWEARYGVAPYTNANPFLWNDMRDGRIADGVRVGVHSRYARPNAPIPVNSIGKILSPIDLGVVYQPGITDATADWKIGDHAPVETAFRRSEAWAFAISQISYLMKPAKFIETGWDANNTFYRYEDQQTPHWVNGTTEDRPRSQELFVHGEELESGEIYVSDGIQQWITNYITSNSQSITTRFGDVIRNVKVQLAHKMGGYINTNSFRSITDNFGLIPNEDISVLLYKSPSIREELYSGVIIERVGTGWSIFGYDVLTPSFTAYLPVKNSRQIAIDVGTTRVLESTQYQEKTKSFQYGTIFTSRQALYDFLIGYGKYLESRGWIFDKFDLTQNENNDWRLSGKQFLFWSQGNWDDGSLLTVSPLAEQVKFNTDHGFIASVEQIVNGVYSLLDRSGSLIQPEDTTVTRDDGTICIIPRNNRFIFSTRLYIVEYEHVLTYANRTIFNDLIYSPLLNLRQARCKLFSSRAGAWDGTYNAPGYIISENNLLPNFEKTTNDITRYFDIEDVVERPALQDSARRITGFQTRDYMDGLNLSDNTQFQFYQGFVRQKGTRLVLDKLFRSEFSDNITNIDIFEEWALRLGDFGSIDDSVTAEFLLQEIDWRSDPQLIEFKNTLQENDPDSKFDDIIEMRLDDSRWVTKPPFSGLVSFPYRTPTGLKRSRNAAYLFRTDVQIAGYPLETEVIFHVDSITDRNSIFGTQKITVEAIDLAFGDLIWVNNVGEFYSLNDPNNINDDDPLSQFNHSFMVFRYTDTGLTFSLPILPADDEGTLVLTNIDHGFADETYIMIDSDTGVVPDINDSYSITVPTKVTGTTFTTIPTLNEGMYITINGQTVDIICDTIDEIIDLINQAKIPNIRAYNSSDKIVLTDVLGNDIVIAVGSPAGVIGSVDGTHFADPSTGHNILINAVSVQFVTGIAKVTGLNNATYTNTENILINAVSVVLSTGTTVDNAVTDIIAAAITGVSAYREINALVITSATPLVLAEGSGTALADLGFAIGTTTLTSTIDDAVTDITTAAIPNIVATNIGNALNIVNTVTTLTIAEGSGTAAADLGLPIGSFDNVLTEVGLTVGTYTTLSTDSFVIPVTIKSDDNAGVHPGTIGIFTESRFSTIAARDGAVINAELGAITFAENDYVYVDTRTPISETLSLWEVYKSDGAGGWTIAVVDNVNRTQAVRIDSELIAPAILYNNDTNITDIKIGIFDPAKGLFPSQAISEIDIKTEYDPAKYTNGDDSVFQIDPTFAWGEERVGKVWWDLSAVEYIDYENGSPRQRKNNWGKILPGKSIDVYEWVKSPVSPLEWENYVTTSSSQPETGFDYKPSGEAYQSDISTNPPYVQIITTNNRTGAIDTVYYFWVKNSETIPNKKNRDFSVARIARIMTNPSFDGVPWFATIDTNIVICSGIEAFLTDTNSVFQLNYNVVQADNNRHREWALSRENDKNDIPTDRFWNKMRDSLIGFDINNDPVPDPNLEQSRRYGNLIRPRQTWFRDREAAAEIFIDAFNTLIKTVCIVDERPTMFSNLNNASALPTEYISLDPITACEYNYHVNDVIERDALVGGLLSINEQVWVDGTMETMGFWKVYRYDGIDAQTQLPIFVQTCSEAYKVSDFWKYIDFYAEGISTTIISDIEVTTITERNALLEQAEGTVVRVLDSAGDGANIWALYQYSLDDEFNPWILIAKKDCAIEFDSSLIIDSTYGNVDVLTGFNGRDQALREIIDALRIDITTDLEQNLLFYTMVRYVFSEQDLVDWAFKTSYILAIGINSSAVQSPLLKKSQTEHIISFINEAKPYHTKLRDFIVNEDFGVDVALSDVYDFDKPVYDGSALAATLISTPETPNLLLESNQINLIPWTSGGVGTSVTPNFVFSPDGKFTADLVKFTAGGGGNASRDQVVTALTTVGQQVTASIWAKVENGTRDFRLGIWDNVSLVQIETKTATTKWQKFTFTGTFSATSTSRYFELYNNTGATAGDIIFWGAKLENGDGIVAVPVHISNQVLDPLIPVDATIMAEETSDQYRWFTNYLTSPENIRTSNVSIVFDRVSCDASGGWDNLFGWDFGTNETWDIITSGANETAADRIIRLYQPQPLSIEDVIGENIDALKNIAETKDIASMISGCSFKGTIVDGSGLIINIDDIDTFLGGGAMEGAPINPDDIIVDGNLFIQPGVDTGHPEELALSSVGESVSICTSTVAMFELISTDITGASYINGETIIINGVTITLSSGVFPADAVIDIKAAVASAADASDIKPITAYFDGTFLRILSTAAITISEGSGTAVVDLGFTNPQTTVAASEPNIALRQFLNNVNNRNSENIKPISRVVLETQLLFSDTEIVVGVTSGIPATGTIIILSFEDDGSPYSEFIDYTIVTDNTLGGLTRTAPSTHPIGNAGVIIDATVPQIASWDSHRINDAATTTLAADFKFGDTEMVLSAVVGLPKQSPGESYLNIPGIIWIGGERIEYNQRDGTTLKYIRRGTGGTSSGTQFIYDVSGNITTSFSTINVGDVIYPIGTRVIDGTRKQEIPGGYGWTSSPGGLQSLNTMSATFLKNGPGTC